MVLLLALMLPYMAAVLFGKSDGKKKQEVAAQENGNIVIMVEKTYGMEELPLEEYLVGSCAASIPAEYEEEAIKAQAVILRSILYTTILQEKKDVKLKNNQYHIEQEALNVNYLNPKERKKLWKSQEKEYEDKIRKAVRETAGLVIQEDYRTISPPYCRVSNGQTRDSDSFPFLRGVICEADLCADSFADEKNYTKKQFIKILEQNHFFLNQISDIRVKYDKSEYATMVYVGNQEISGEDFKKNFELASSSFHIDQYDGKIRIRTKGIGHGFGMSQYTANVMAKKGEDFLTILHYFFQNIDIEKIV